MAPSKRTYPKDMYPFGPNDIVMFQPPHNHRLSKLRERLYLCLFRSQTHGSQERFGLMSTTGRKSSVKCDTKTIYFGVPPKNSNDSVTHIVTPNTPLENILVMVYVAKVKDLKRVETELKKISVHGTDEDGSRWVDAAVKALFKANRSAQVWPLFEDTLLPTKPWSTWKAVVEEFRRKCEANGLLWREVGDEVPILDYFKYEESVRKANKGGSH